MLVLENTDLLQGDATTAAECDYSVFGLDNNILKQMADGQLPNTKGTLYTADSVDVISTIIITNTGAAHNHVNLYIAPAAGTSRRLIAKDLQLEPGYSLHFDGKSVMVLNIVGQIIYVGATGADGADGAAATIAVGDVSAVPSGTPPTVTNTGSSSVAVFDFELETGAKGDQGPSGTLPIADAGGAVDAITANYTPDLTLSDKMLCAIVAAGANITTTPTFAPDGLTAHTIVKKGGSALVAGDIAAAGMVCILEYNLANTRWELLNPAVSGTTITFASAAEIVTGTEAAKAIAPGQLNAANIRLPMDHLSGLTMSNAADVDHDITIAAGKCRSSTDDQDMVLAAAITKQGDAAWAVGTNAGAMDTGSLPSAGTIHVWLIKRSDTGVVDVLFSISATAPTMPANYNYKRLIGSYCTVVTTGHIINGDWIGTGLHRTFIYDTPILDVSAANPGTNAVTAALSTPGGIITKSQLSVYIDANADRIYISSLASGDIDPGDTVALTLSIGAGGGIGGFGVLTNTSSQIRYRVDANGQVYIWCYGYEQFL